MKKIIYTLTILLFGFFSFSQTIELLYFKANQNNNNVLLRWKTVAETNNNYFTIEKSIDCEFFEVIGTVRGAGTSNSVNSYSFVDFNVWDNISYYRLKQTDFDGKFKYFDIIYVEKIKNRNKIRVYPNSTGEDYEVRVKGLQPNDIVTAINLMGSICNVNHLKKGIYIIYVNGEVLEKLVVK